ncbi:MAG TPA: hypothetical protein PKV35_04630, partial [bacterium]|nr:hypothetical protein [bacterium]
SQIPVQAVDSGKWESVVAGNNSSCGIKNDGELSCWGYIGDISSEEIIKWSSVSIFGSGVCGISEGKLFCAEREYQPFVQMDDNDDWNVISSDYRRACGIRSGELYCWGDNLNGELGIDSEINIKSPTRVGEFNDWSVIYVSSGYICGIRNGEVSCWGWNELDFNFDNSENDWTDVSSSEYDICGIKSGKLFCAYYKEDIEQIGNDSDWTSVSVGRNYICGIRDSKLFCWGDNSTGQLGNGKAWELTPVPVVEP